MHYMTHHHSSNNINSTFYGCISRLFRAKKGWSSVSKINKPLRELKSSDNDDSSDDVGPFAT
jgi:hypothetical protein